MKKFKPEKAFQTSSERWWHSLTFIQKANAMNQYEALRLSNNKRVYPYTDMRDVCSTRISKLNGKDIYCLFRFKDSYEL